MSISRRGEAIQVTTDPPRAGQAARDMGPHFTVIAAINLVLAIPGALIGLLLFFGGLVGGGIVGAFSDVPGLGGLIASAGFFLGLVIMALALPPIVSGVGLLQRRSWAKIWTMIASVLHLFNIPIGTAFGVYALWAMTRPETDRALDDAPGDGVDPTQPQPP